jgi:hypothetical protein
MPLIETADLGALSSRNKAMTAHCELKVAMREDLALRARSVVRRVLPSNLDG